MSADFFCRACDWEGTTASCADEERDVSSCPDCGEVCAHCEERAWEGPPMVCPECGDPDLMTYEEMAERDEDKLKAWNEWALMGARA